MTYAEVSAFHDRVWELYPDQSKHSDGLLATFFEGIEARRVLEVGGWRGEAAGLMLSAHPAIERWENYELCAGAVHHPVTVDPRYRGILPDVWPWEMTAEPADTAVLAHVIEHMRAAQLERLIGWLAGAGVEHAYIEAPLRNRPRGWRHSSSAHVLEIGWNEVTSMLAHRGLLVSERHAYPPDRVVLFIGR